MTVAPSELMTAFVALGSNLGDRLVNLRHAVERLAAHPRVRIVRCSRVYESPPMGPPDQGPYLNAVVALETSVSPGGLLALCQQIEVAGRRQRTLHWGPRTIDLDLVDAGGLVITTPTLHLPHPGVRERAFVLVPLSDVSPGWTHPVTGESVEELVGKVAPDGKASIRVVAQAEKWCRLAVRPGRAT